MKISLTKTDSYDLEINGVAYKNMRVTGKLEGIMELSNGTSTATLCRTEKNRFAEMFAGIFNDGKDEAWMPIRGTPDIHKAMALKVVDALPQQPAWPQPQKKDAPLLWPDLICEHDWVPNLTYNRRICTFCKKSEGVTA